MLRHRLLFLLCSLLLRTAGAETSIDYAVPLSVTPAATPPSLRISWPKRPKVTGYEVSRKLPSETAWTPLQKLPATALNYTDRTVAIGVEYEYRVLASAHEPKDGPRGPAHDFTAHGIISAGIEVPLVEQRGQAILMVDQTQAAALATEIERLKQDLRGDGWTVIRHDVARDASPPSVKALILGDQPTGTAALFLLGHIPVPYSGDLYPDTHEAHMGAWPADVYYGDLTGEWTDRTVDDSQSIFDLNHNVPGDGKFDQSYVPGVVALQVGRVDLSNLPEFALPETELLRQYLNRDHAFRHKRLAVAPHGLVLDAFPDEPEAYAANGVDYLSALLGPANVAIPPTSEPARPQPYGALFKFAGAKPYLFAYACNNGTEGALDYFGSTSDFATTKSRAVFLGFFGSIFGDWDAEGNFLRAPLANDGYGLAAVYTRPYWYFHPMGLGRTVGYCAQLTQNNDGLYPTTLYARAVHIALMGDPTLRMQQVAPPSAVSVSFATPGAPRQLTWRASPDIIAGYHVYRATGPAEPFVRLTEKLVTGHAFTDADPVEGAGYQVTAVRLERSNSGSYWNSSQAISAQLAPPIASVSLSQPVASAFNLRPAEVRFTRTGDDDVPLTLAYTVSGTAVAGWDYEALSGQVTIPAGSSSAPLSIKPLLAPPGFGRTLTLTLAPSGDYRLGTARANVRIAGQANAWAAVSGTYRGPLTSTTLPPSSLTLTLTPTGSFTAALRVGSARCAFLGKLSGTGQLDVVTSIGVRLLLALDWSTDPIQLTADVIETSSDTVVGSFSAGR